MSSGGRPLKPEEIEAGRLFHVLTGLECEELDGTAAGSGLPDFSLRDPTNGHVRGTLEVTQHTSQQAQAAIAAIGKKDWTLAKGLGTWRVDVEAKANLGSVLPVLEHLMRQAVAARDATIDRLGPAAAVMTANKILRMAQLDPGGPDEAHVMVGHLGGATSRDVLADVVEQSVNDNASKLVPAPGAERHLLTWLDWYGPLGADAMAGSLARGLPGTDPRPPAVQLACTVWLSVTGARWAVRWRNTAGWDVVPAQLSPGTYAPGALVPSQPAVPVARPSGSV